MFVLLAEPRLMIYIRVVGTKGRHLMLDETSGFSGPGLEGVSMECYRYVMLLLFRFKNYEIHYF